MDTSFSLFLLIPIIGVLVYFVGVSQGYKRFKDGKPKFPWSKKNAGTL